MLPKLQQSSIANSLRRDNLASQIQCNSNITKAKTNSKASFLNKTINPINHGKITTLPKTLIVHSEISLKNIYPKIKLSNRTTNLSINILFQDPWLNMNVQEEMEAKVQALSKKDKNFKSLYLNQELLSSEISLHHSSEGTMTEEIYQSE